MTTDAAETLGRYRPYLALLVRVHLSRPHRYKLDTSDLVQETLLEAHRKWHQFRGASEAELAGWLRQILAHNIADAVRKQGRAKRDVAREVALDETLTRIENWVHVVQSSPSQKAQRREELVRLAAALEALPEAQRVAIERYHLHGESLAEVAETLERSESAVAGLLYRGLKKVRQLLSEPEK